MYVDLTRPPPKLVGVSLRRRVSDLIRPPAKVVGYHRVRVLVI